MMSSALAMVLMAAMAVPANGPEKVSGEVKDERLDLRGDWRGTSVNSEGRRQVVYVRDGRLMYQSVNVWRSYTDDINFARLADVGANRFQAESQDERFTYFGIDTRDGDRLTICFRRSEYPKTFRAGSGQVFLTLERVRGDGLGPLFLIGGGRVRERRK